MGGGIYSSTRRTKNIMSNITYSAFGADTAPENVFKNKSINSAMNPFGVKIRESRDSEEHPNSFAVILGLDETGSMGTVPHYLVQEGLPQIMDSIIKKGIPDLQLLFLGIGDHTCDSSPLQVGQFESSDELLDKWLTDLYLEGLGGGNYGESYMLAWYFAAKHTSIDCFEKRKDKGVLITIGDEPVLEGITAKALKHIMGDGQYENYTSKKLLDEASKMYNVYHINSKATYSGQRQDVIDGWKQLLADNLIIAERREDIPKLVTDIVLKNAPKESAITNSVSEIVPKVNL